MYVNMPCIMDPYGKKHLWWLDFDGRYDLWAEKSESRICLVSTHLQRNPEDLSQVDMGGVIGSMRSNTEKRLRLFEWQDLGAEFDGHDIIKNGDNLPDFPGLYCPLVELYSDWVLKLLYL